MMLLLEAFSAGSASLSLSGLSDGVVLPTDEISVGLIGRQVQKEGQQANKMQAGIQNEQLVPIFCSGLTK